LIRLGADRGTIRRSQQRLVRLPFAAGVQRLQKLYFAAREQRHRQHVIANVTSDRAEQRDYQEVARPRTWRAFRFRLARAADQEADRKREQKSKRGRIRAGRLGHRGCDVSEMST